MRLAWGWLILYLLWFWVGQTHASESTPSWEGIVIHTTDTSLNYTKEMCDDDFLLTPQCERGFMGCCDRCA